MRTTASVLLAGLLLAGCARDVTAPALDISATAAADAAADVANATAASGALIKVIGTLPDSLKLSAEQRTKISSLTEAFERATKPDRDSITVARAAAQSARKAGKSEAEIKAILARASAAEQRISAADAALVTAIRSVLTAKQDAWVAAHQPAPHAEPPKTPPAPVPPRADTAKTPPAPVAPRVPIPQVVELARRLPDNLKLTTEQKAKLDAAVAAYTTSVQADVQAIAAVEARAADAKRAGKSADDVAKINAEADPARARVKTAQEALTKLVLGFLTAEQKAWITANTPTTKR